MERNTISVLCVTHQGCVWKEHCSAGLKIEICGISENRLSCHRCTAGMTSPLCCQPSPKDCSCTVKMKGSRAWGRKKERESESETGVGVFGWTERGERDRVFETKEKGGGVGGWRALSLAAVSFSLCSSLAFFSSLQSITQTLYVWRPASILRLAFSICWWNWFSLVGDISDNFTC